MPILLFSGSILRLFCMLFEATNVSSRLTVLSQNLAVNSDLDLALVTVIWRIRARLIFLIFEVETKLFFPPIGVEL